MRKIYSFLFFLNYLALIAQCEPVSTLNEDFSDFTILPSEAFPQKCWTAYAISMYTEESGDPLNQYVVYWNAMIQNAGGYLVTPELNAITEDYTLSFEVFKVPNSNGTYNSNYAQVQVGTCQNSTSSTSPPYDLVTYGDPIVITPNRSTYSISITAPANHKHIVFILAPNATRMFLGLDNIKYQPSLETKKSPKYYFNIYQNPEEKKILRISKNIDANTKFSIYDVNGINVYKNILNNNTEQFINLSFLPSGMYIAKIESDYFSDSKKFVIK